MKDYQFLFWSPNSFVGKLTTGKSLLSSFKLNTFTLHLSRHTSNYLSKSTWQKLIEKKVKVTLKSTLKLEVQFNILISTS